MAARHDGAVIFIASIAGLRGSAGISAYGAAKAAVMQLGRSLACEWGQYNIRVNSIAPGLIKTDFARALWADWSLARRRIAETPLGRLGRAERCGRRGRVPGIPAGSFITGQTIIVDGGVTIAG